jgi:hypothetical protein
MDYPTRINVTPKSVRQIMIKYEHLIYKCGCIKKTEKIHFYINSLNVIFFFNSMLSAIINIFYLNINPLSVRQKIIK